MKPIYLSNIILLDKNAERIKNFKNLSSIIEAAKLFFSKAKLSGEVICNITHKYGDFVCDLPEKHGSIYQKEDYFYFVFKDGSFE